MLDKRIIIAITSILVIVSLLLFFRETKHKKKLSISEPRRAEKFSGKILILLCYANWCGHCQTLKPKFAELTKTQPISDVDFDMVEESDKTRYVEFTKEVSSYPTLVIDDGQTVSTFVGITKIKEVLNRFEIKL